MKVQGKVVVITGAARGQGLAAARLLAAEGAQVVATDVLPAEVVVEGVEHRHLDVTDEAGWAALAEALRERHGRVDALVNNAGIAARERLPHVSAEGWRRALDVNATGPLLGIQALVPLMPPGSSIVNVCSVAAVSGHAAAAYTASKWALRGLTRSAALELGSTRGIRVNAVMPGFIDTPLMASASGAFLGAAVAEVPLGRVGTPEDVAPTIAFLCSDDSAYYNGAELVVDGGLTAHVSHKRIADETRPAAEDVSR
ncbi:SDR family oxidoreductase [Nocardioides sp. GY 10127]|uniref:SDR family NAD(P)-dependent oxidoreductase n=1 Tax=Nocardioides sp. GY 10127 TaxID=2569762 RepID=UPI0010A803F8|nr:SDR family oxidoreductase [Nocardioides sp. GY 10127]TIC80160.1 SDR family oxidoreductase [Nocardioides sp. GY 10127]